MKSPWIVDAPDDEIPGYTSTVHHSQLEVNRWGGVPHHACLANAFLAFMVFIGTSIGWRWFPVAVLIHGLLALLTWGDARRIEKFVRYLSYRRHYAAHVQKRQRHKASRYDDVFMQQALKDEVIQDADRVLAQLKDR